LQFSICNLFQPRALLFAATLLTLASAGARADTLWIGSTGTGAIQITNAKITKVERGLIFFTTSGSETSRELNRVQKINIDGEPAFNVAEEAFADGKFPAAVDGYLRTVRSATKPWLKDWSAARLLAAADKANRFDAAATAYIALVTRDPANAAVQRPLLPAERSTFLDGAANEVNAALGTANLTDDQRVGLLGFLVDIQRSRGDKAAEDQAADKLDEILAKDPTKPAAAAAITRRKLQSARAALDAKEFARAASEIVANRNAFTDPAQQADALFILAEAKNGQVAGKNDPPVLKDVALAYMRVVANFRDVPSAKTQAAEALLKTAEIYERLHEPQTAAKVYAQVATEFPDTPAAANAKQAAQRLTTK
jgi:TolA-binding protein